MMFSTEKLSEENDSVERKKAKNTVKINVDIANIKTNNLEDS